MPEPAFRSVMCKKALALIESDPELSELVLKGVPDEHLTAIRSAGRLAWVPAEALNALNHCYLHHAGQDAFIQLWRRYTVESVDTPLFGPLFQGALRLFGLNPGSLIRLIGRAWDSATRDVCRIECTLEDNAAHVQLLDIPPTHREIVLSLCMQGVILAIFDLTHHRGEVRGDESELFVDGRCDVHARW